MAFIQGIVAEKSIYLTLVDAPALGVLPTDVVCRYKKEGQTSLTTKTLTSANWFELGNGFYTIRFTALETDTQGSLFYTLISTKFDNFIYDDFTIEPPSSAAAPFVPPGFCQVSGNLLTVGNTIPVGTPITFRPALFPLTVNGAVVTADKVMTYPDITGAFQVNLIRGSLVIVEIERTGVRAQIQIPDATTADLMDLLPPFGA